MRIARGMRGVVVALACVLALMLAMLSGCTSAASSSSGPTGSGATVATGAKNGKGTLRVGVRADIMGFGYLNEKTKKYYGMEIDMAKDMAGRMGYKDVQFVTVTPETRKEMLLSGKIDAIVACYSISDTRRKNFDFSPAYYTASVKMIVQNSSGIKKMADLKGGVIGTMAGANTAPLLNIELKDTGFSNGVAISGDPEKNDKDVQFDTYRLVQYPSYQTLSDALEEGKVDAMAMDSAIGQTYMNEYRSILPDFSIDPQEYGVATQKGSELSGKVGKTVRAMLDDGTIKRYIDKWN